MTVNAGPPSGGLAKVLYPIQRELRRNGTLYLMALPAVAIIFVVSYMPMPVIILSFKDYIPSTCIWGSYWVGLKNFEFLFNSGIAWQIIRNTLLLNFLFIIAAQVSSLTCAVFMNEIYHKYIAKV
ncbi:MAG: hypothetical protein HY835_12425, partial [Anaerolineae bacterium]|nr:hypothetical protein [Anaerolineae bacterium]